MLEEKADSHAIVHQLKDLISKVFDLAEADFFKIRGVQNIGFTKNQHCQTVN